MKERPQAVKEKINISPHETAVAANLSVIENLELTAGIYGQNSKSAKKSADEIASLFGRYGVRKKSKTIITHMSLLNGGIVFVNDDNRNNTVMLIKHLRKPQQRHLEIIFVCAAI